MTQLYLETGDSSNLSVPAPTLQGSYYTGIDLEPQIDGWGYTVPLGGGATDPSTVTYGVPAEAPSYLENVVASLATRLASVGGQGATNTYNFTGLIGPQGPPGQPGPPTITSTGVESGSGAAILDFGKPFFSSSIVWSDNSPSEGYVSWTAGTCKLSTATYDIAAGNTNNEFIYWDSSSPNEFGSTDVRDDAVSSTRWLVARNIDGSAYPIYEGAKLWDGQFLRDATIKAAQIASDAIIEAKLADDAVTALKINVLGLDPLTGTIATDHITTAMIKDAQISTAKLIDNCVTSDKTSLAAISSITGYLNENVVDTNQVVNDAITAAKTAIAALDGETGNLVANSVNTSQVVDDAITAAKTSLAAIDGETGNLTANSVDTTQIVDDAITAAKTDLTAINGTDGTLNSGVVDTAQLATGAVEEAKIAADAVTALKISVAGLDGETGYIKVSDEAAANIVTDGVNTYATTYIAPGKVLISGETNLDDWSHGDDATYIDGGKIYADSVTATQINVIGLDGTSGHILVTNQDAADQITTGINSYAVTKIDAEKITITSATGANGVTDGINTYAETTIAPGKVLISGETLLSDWSSGEDATYIDGGKVYTGTITADQIAANAVTATKIDVTGLDGETGQINVASEVQANVITDAINTYASTNIAPGKVLISGEVNLDDWSSGEDATYIDGGKIYTDSITANQIAAGGVTSDEIAANAVTATKIDVLGLDGETGQINVSNETNANVITDGINTYASTNIQAGKILISGEVNLDDWSASGNATYIDGGKIYTDSITATQIDGGTITATELASNSVTTDKILASNVTAAKIDVAGLDGDGYIQITEITAANSITGGVNTYATTKIDAEKITISSAAGANEITGGINTYAETAIDAEGIAISSADGADIITGGINTYATTKIDAEGITISSATGADIVTAGINTYATTDIDAGHITVTDATGANVLTDGINSWASTYIAPGKVLISGETNLDDWRAAGDNTYIDGGKIYADSVTAEKINVIGLDGAEGHILVTNADGANSVTGGINSYATTLISAGKILVGSATDVTSNEVIHYAMEDNAASTAVDDTSGNENDGTSTTNTSNLNYDGKFDDGFQFTATSTEAVGCGGAYQSEFRGSHTICFFAKPADGNPSSSQVLVGVEDGTSHVRIELLTTGYINWEYTAGGNTGNDAATNNPIFADGAASDWVHIACVADSTVGGAGGKKIYINGVLDDLDGSADGSTSGVTFGDFTSTDTLYIGAMNDDTSLGEYYDGLMDEFHFFDKALSAAEVQAVMRNVYSGETIGVDDWGDSVDATLIDGGFIATDTIQARHLAADSITAGNIVAGSVTTNKIYTQAVTTVKIEDGATAITAFGTDASETTYSASPQTMCSAGITSEGNVIRISFGTNITGKDVGEVQQIRIQDGSNVLYTEEVGTEDGWHGGTVMAAPGAGAVTYYLQMWGDGNAASQFTCASSVLEVQEDLGK